MELLFGLLVAFAAIGIVSYPLLREQGGRRSAGELQARDLEDLLAQREAVYSAIRELEFDRDTGNLSDQDFEELRERQKSRAIALLREIDDAERAQSAGRRRDVKRPREDRRAQTSQRQPSTQHLERRFCPKCGKQHQPDDRFCPKCGVQLN